MRISDVRSFKFTFERSSWLLLAVETDSGIVGWGDMSDACLCDALAQTAEARKAALIGMDPLRITECEGVISALKRPAMSVVRGVALIQSALNQALWDITAKHYGVPLYKLYGGDGTDKIPLYGNLNNAIRDRRRPEDLHQQGLAAKEAGFQVVKCTPFDEVRYGSPACDLDKGFERIRALTEIYPIEQIAIDCHQRFERYNFARMVERVLAEFGNPYWIEDPVPALDHDTIRIMAARYPQVRWTAGEDAFCPADLMRTACTNCYDVLMPDIKLVGGPGVVRGMADAIRGMGKTLTLHNPSGVVATAHSAHVSAVCRGLPLEFPVSAVPGRELLTTPEEPVREGMYCLPDLPGIGIALRPSVFEQYGVEWVDSKWAGVETLPGAS